jgi:hypothetical protein
MELSLEVVVHHQHQDRLVQLERLELMQRMVHLERLVLLELLV